MKKLISAIVSLAVACAGLTAVNAGASASRPFDTNSDEFAGYEELYHIEDAERSYSVFTSMVTIVDEDADINVTFRNYRQVMYENGYVNIGVYCDNDILDKRITDILDSYGVTDFRTEYKNCVMMYIAALPDDFSYAREFYNKIAEMSDLHLYDFYIKCGGIYVGGSGYIPYKSPTYYHWGISEKQIDSLAEYVREKNLDFTLERGELKHEANERYDALYECNLIPNYDIDFDEHLQIGADIANTLGIDIPILYNSSADTASGFEKIDILNSVDGDANGDGTMNIADAAAVVQALGNKDKYGLSAQGEFNADLDGNGLTGADALSIQIMVAEAGMPE